MKLLFTRRIVLIWIALVTVLSLGLVQIFISPGNTARAQGLSYQADLNKSFNPTYISAGGISRLTVVIFNPNPFALTLSSSPPAWKDDLDARLNFASPPNITTDCGGTVTTIGRTLALIGGTVPAKINTTNGECTVSVDVTATTAGDIPNTIPAGALNATSADGQTAVTNTSPATVDLLVNAVQPPSLSKSFNPNTIWAGRTSVLTITIRNNDSQTDLSAVSITDNLPANIVVAAPPNASTTCNGIVNGAVSAIPGAASVSLSNGSVPKAGNCSLSVTVTSASAGVYTNLIPANALQTQQGVTNASAASAPLNVQAIGITKSFSPGNFQLNGISTLTITLQNPTNGDYHGASFTDTFPAGLLIANPANASNACGGSLIATSGSGFVKLTGGVIPLGSPGGCSIKVDVTSLTPASYTNSIPVGALTTTEGASNVVAAFANISVYGSGLGLNAGKSFNPATIAVNGKSQLSISITAPADKKLTNVTLSDALPAGVVVAASPNASTASCAGSAGDPTPVFSPSSGDSLLSFSNGSILAGATCTLRVDITSSAPGVYVNTISPANISDSEDRNIGGNISATLTVSGISVSKSFSPTSINPGGISTLSITLSNNNSDQLDSVSFSDTLPLVDASNGVFIAPIPNLTTTCGLPGIISLNTNAVTGAQTISMAGGTIPAQVGGVPGICTVNIDVVGKGSATTYTNTISKGNVAGTIHNTSTVITNPSSASAALQILPIRIDIVQGFAPVSVFGGSASTLTITLTNPTGVELTGIHFIDHLPVSLTDPLRGMKVANPAFASVGTCGGTLTANPWANWFDFSGGDLPPNVTCQLTLMVTMNVNSNLTNVIHTGDVTTTNGAANLSDVNATLTNQPGASVSKIFSLNPISAGGGNVTTLTITIQNLSNFPLTGLGLIDTLPSGMTVAAAPDLLQCNTGTVNTTSDTISLTGGSLADLSSCDIVVQVTAPNPGSYSNCIPIGALTDVQNGTNKSAACDTLTVLPVPSAPIFSKAFSPATIPAGSTSALTFTLANPAGNTTALSEVGFTDTFPAGLTMASVPNAAQCNSGSVSYTPNSITLMKGTLPIHGTCTVTASVTAGLGGVYPNTSGPVSWTFNGSPYSGGTATDTLTVVSPPVISKAFSPASITSGGSSTLTFTITNPLENTLALTGVGFEDPLPAGVKVSVAPAASITGCSASSTPVFGPNADDTQLTLTSASIAVGGTCTLSVNVTAGGGTYVNTTDAVTSSNGGTGNTASDTLTVAGGGLELEKSTTTAGFAKVGDTIHYSYLLTNTGTLKLYGSGASGEFIVNDNKANVICPVDVTSLETSPQPGSSVVCTADYLAQAGDVTARSVVNTATASALDALTNGNLITSNPDSVTVRLEALTIKKRTSTAGFRNINDHIDYTYTLTNTGDVTLYGSGASGEFMVLDDHIGSLPGGTAFACDAATKSLAPGENVACFGSKTYLVTSNDISAGLVTNKVTAVAQDKPAGGNTVTSNEDSVTVYLITPPIITKAFGAAGKTIPVGGTSLLTFTITNPDGNVVPLMGVHFIDNLPANLTLAADPDQYQCGGTVFSTATQIALNGGTILPHNSCTVTVSVTSGEAGSYANTTGIVTSSNGGNGLASNTDTLFVVAPPVITKAFSPTTILPNGKSTITFTITNPNASASLSEVSFTDAFPAGLQADDPLTTSLTNCGAQSALDFGMGSPPYTSFSFSKGSVAPGVACVITVKVTATTPGIKLNTTGPISSKEGGTGSTSNTAVLNVDNPHMSLTKSIAAGNPYTRVGGTLTYSYQLVNDGNVTLIGNGAGGRFTITDDHISGGTAFNCPASPAGLVPGDTLTCTGTYTVTQQDVDDGSVTNTASGHGFYVDASGNHSVDTNLSPATATATQIDSLTLVKTATSGEPYSSIGTVVNYSYRLTNSGNVTLTGTDTDGGFIVSDDKLGSVTCPDRRTSLGQDDFITCTASYHSVTQSDLDAGSITNTATGYAKWKLKDETATSTKVVLATQIKTLYLDKMITSGGSYNQVGAVIFYQYTLTNTGNVTLQGDASTGGVFSIGDDHINGGAHFACGAATSLEPLGVGSVTCTASYTVTQPDVDSGSVVNHATGHGSFGGVDVASNQATQTATKAPSWNLGFAKTLETTEFNSVGNDHTQAVIGEQLTYKLVVTIPEGTTLQTKVVDTLDAGLAFVNVESITASNPDTDGEAALGDNGLNSTKMTFDGAGQCTNCTAGTVVGASNPLVENNGGKLTFDLGRVINTNTDVTPETITIVYKVVVLNTVGNQAGTKLNNSALLSWSGGSSPATAADVTVVEPVVAINKSVDLSSAVDASDPLNYTITLTSSVTPAYDVTLSDPLPVYLSNPTISSVTGAAAPADFEIVGCPGACQLQTRAAANLDLDPGAVITIMVQGTIATATPPNTSLSNTATVYWTSLNGVIAARSSFNPASLERTGADGVSGGLNDYAASSQAVTLTNPMVLTKSLVSTSELHTSGSDVTIGEIARFRLQVLVPEGTSRNLQLLDRLPPGLTFLNDGTARFAFVCTNMGAGCAPTSSTLPGSIWVSTNASVDAVTPSYVLQDADISTSPSANSDVYDSGSDVYFKLGDLVNTSNDPNSEYVIVEFNALADNSLTGNNTNGKTLSNDFIAYENGAPSGNTPAAVVLTVREPNVVVTKSVPSPTGYQAGDNIIYTASYTNSGTADAFEVNLKDSLPAQFDLTAVATPAYNDGNICLTPTVTDASDLAAGVVNVTLDRVRPGCTVTVTYNVTLRLSVIPHQVLTNTANVIYTSLPGSGTLVNPTGSTTPGASGDWNGERNQNTGASGGANNDYSSSSSANITIDNVAPVKTIIATSEGHTSDGTADTVGDPRPVAIGEIVRYRLAVQIPEGTSTNFRVTDIVPLGLTYLPGTLTLKYVSDTPVTNADGTANTDLSGANGAAISLPAGYFTYTSATHTLAIDLKSPVNNDADGNVEQVWLEYNALVNNDATNHTGILHDNSFTVQVNGSDNPSGHVFSKVVEPNIPFSAVANNKTVTSSTSNVDAGDVVSYQVVYTNTGSTDAFDVVITDDMSLLPFSTVTYTNTAFSGCTAPGAADTSASTGTKLVVNVPRVSVGCQVTITYTATATTAIQPSQTYTNTAAIQYSSLPGTNGTTGNSTGSNTPGTPGASDGERNDNLGATGGASNHYSGSDTASITTRIPVMSKTISTTELNVAGNDHTQASIGELVTYQLVITVPEGTTPALKVVDTLDPGLAFVHCVSVTPSAGVTTSLGNFSTACADGTSGNPAITLSGSVATFNFGTVTNSNTEVGDPTADTITVLYTVLPLDMNSAPNLQSGSLLNNSAVISWTGSGVQAAVSAPNVTIVEPTLSISKTRTLTGADAGDTTRFSITVTNANAASDTVAFDVVFSDVIPAGLTYTGAPAVGSCSAGAPVFAYDGPSTTLTATWDTFAKNSSCTFTFDTKIDANVTPAQAIAGNTGQVRWTSIPGARSAYTSYNPASNERTGADGLLGAGSLNDYRAQSLVAGFNVDNVQVQKAVAATSEAHTAGTTLAIGEIVRYRLVMQLPESTVTDLQLSDTLAGTGGQRFLNDGSAKVLFVGSGGISSADYAASSVPGIVGCTNYSGTFTLAQAANPAVIPSSAVNCSLANANITSTENSNTDTYPTNGAVHFQLGTLTNADDSTDPEFIIVEFNVLVTNEAANTDAKTLTDNFIVRRWNGAAMVNLGAVSNTLTQTVVEPHIPFSTIANNKTVTSSTSNVDAGDMVSYQVVYTNTGSTDAFDVVITDDMGLLPFNTVTYTNTVFTGCTTPGAADTTGSTGTKLVVNVPRVSVGCQVTITYTATATTAIRPSQTYTNTAAIQYSSLPGTNGTAGNSTGSNTPGTPGASDGERNDNLGATGGASNHYSGSDTASITTRIPSMSKTLTATELVGTGNDLLSQAAIGEMLTYDLVITVPEGTTPALKVVDTLDAGLGFDHCVSVIPSSGALSTSLAGGFGDACNPGLTAGTNNPLITLSGSVASYDLGTVTNTNTDNATPETITIRYQVMVLNILANQNTGSTGTTGLANAALLSWTGGSQGVVSANKVKIVEPTLTLSKTRPAVTNPEAGDTVTFTVTVANGNAASDTGAYDAFFRDVIPAGLNYVSNSAVTTVCTSTSAPVFGYDAPSRTLTASWGLIDPNQSCQFTFGTTLDVGINPNQTGFANTGELRWTSLPGAHSAANLYNPNSVERTGPAGAIGSDALNNYGAQAATAVFTTANVAPVKTIIATSEVHTSDSTADTLGDPRPVAIGEIVRYRLAVQIPEGTSTNFRVTDVVPLGLTYLPGTLTLKYVSDNPIINTDGTANTDLNGANAAAITLPAGYFTYTPATHTLAIDLKSPVNNDTDGNVEQVWLEYSALVNNDATNHNGTLHDNAFTVQVNGSDNPSRHVFTKVVEPTLLLAKTASADTGWKYGDTVSYTLSLTSDVTSTAAAFNLRIQDIVPAGLTFSGFTSTPPGWVADSSADPTLVWTCDPDTNPTCEVPAGGSASFTYDVQVNLSTDAVHLKGNDTATNTAVLTWTSLPGPNGTLSNPTGSTTPGASGASNGERNGSGSPVFNSYTKTSMHTGRLTDYYSLGNRVWIDTNNNGVMDGSEVGQDGVLVQLYAAADTTFANVLASDTTRNGGFYLFDYLLPGDYVIVIPASNFTGAGKLVGDWSSGTYINSSSVVSETPALDADIVPTDGDDNGLLQGGAVITLPITLGPPGEPVGEAASQLEVGVVQGVQPDDRANMTVDFGFFQMTSIGDFVWLDTNANGIQDAGESGINGVTVDLYRPGYGPDGIAGNGDDAAVVASTTTAQLFGVDGSYSFINLVPGSYYLQFAAPPGTAISPLNKGADPTKDSDVNPASSKTAAILLVSGMNDTTWDMGVYETASIGDFVWTDTNANGIQDAGESGLNGVTVNLYRPGVGPDGIPGNGDDAAIVATTTTVNVAGVNGSYSFKNLVPGNYSLGFVTPLGYTISPINQGGDPLKDSDADPATGKTINTTLISGQNDLTWDMGVYQIASIGDFVWTDTNANGIQDAGESGINGVTVNLYRPGVGPDGIPGNGDDAAVVATTTTANVVGINGSYSFTNLVPGTYSLGFAAPLGYTISPTHQGGDSLKDSDADPATGKTATTTLVSGQNDLSWDMGVYQVASLGDYVWDDINFNGIQDAGESGINGVKVELFTSQGVSAGVATTDVNGAYSFTNLVPDDYYVVFTLPSGYVFSPVGAGGNLAKDSNANPLTGKTGNVTLGSADVDPTIDAGMYIALPSLSIAKTANPLTYAIVGTVIHYNFLVTNTGNVTLNGPFTVSDDKATDENCPAGNLVAGAAITCTASYTITQNDLDAGSVTNYASAGNGTITSGTDHATVTAVQASSLKVVKSSTTLAVTAAGQVVPYTYLVTNTGNVTVTGIALADTHVDSAPSCPAATLAAGAQLTCTAQYTVTLAEMNAGGQLTNVVTVTSSNAPLVTDTLNIPINQSPTLSVVKSSTTVAVTAALQMVPYRYLVTNTGNVTVTGIVVTDNHVDSAPSCPQTDLTPGANMTCTAQYTITQAEMDAGGQLTNVVTVNSTNAPAATDTLKIPINRAPALAIKKTATPMTYAVVGDIIHYTFHVTNSGNVTLPGPFTVNDDRASDETCPAGDLVPGAALDCTATYTIQQSDLDTGSVTNIASASNGTITSLTDTVTVTAQQSPTLMIKKTAVPATYAAVGDVISYTYLVTNTGNVTLTGPFTVSDNKLASVVCPAGDLGPGAALTCTAAYTITQTDLDAGSVANTASASNGTVTSLTDHATVTAVQSPALAIVKSANPQTYTTVGEAIDYSYVLTNTGNVTLVRPFTVSDDKAVVTCPPAPVVLAPYATITCTSTYHASQADLNLGTLTNTASGHAVFGTTPVDTETVSVTITAVQTSGLTLAKSIVSGNPYSKAGDVIAYSYLLTNSGNVTLTGPFTVSDDKVTVTCPALPATLDAGETTTCTAAYTVVDTDLDGSVINHATGHALYGAVPVDSNEDTQTATGTHLTASKLAVDIDNDGIVTPGDVLEYTIIITNSGMADAKQVILNDSPDANTTLVVSSVTTSAGTVTTGNTLGDKIVQVQLGTLVGQTGTATITFRVKIVNPLPAGVTSVSNQGLFSGSNFPVVSTDNQPNPKNPGQPTVTPVIATPHLVATKSFTLALDPDLSVLPSPGDTLQYTIHIANTGDVAETAVIFDDTPDANTDLVPGTVNASQGIVIQGNQAGNTTVSVNLGVLPGGGAQANISFKVTIKNPFPAGTTTIFNQGTVQGQSTSIVTDDPSTAPPSDPTMTPVVRPTAVDLLYFRINPISKKQVLVSWATASEVDNYGFWIKRALVNDYSKAEKVTFVPTSLQSGKGSGTTYQYVDSIPQDGPWYYWLVDVDTEGNETIHATGVAKNNFLPPSIFVPMVRH